MTEPTIEQRLSKWENTDLAGLIEVIGELAEIGMQTRTLMQEMFDWLQEPAPAGSGELAGAIKLFTQAMRDFGGHIDGLGQKIDGLRVSVDQLPAAVARAVTTGEVS